MSRTLFIALLIGLLPYAMSHGATGQEIYILVARDEITRIVMPERARYDSLSAERQAEVLRTIKTQRDSPDAEVRSDAWRSLVALEDEEAIRTVVKAFIEDYYSDAYPGAFSFSTPAVIPHLIDAIYSIPKPLTREDHLRAQEHNALSLTIRDRAAYLALGYLTERWFPADTRKWAEAVGNVAINEPYGPGWPLIAEQFKVWWERNKEAVLAKQYDKATWLPSEVPESVAKFWKPPGAATAAPATLRPAPPATSAPPPSAPSRLPWLLGALAALALAAVAVRTIRHR
jgi:hypothetical protein